MYHSQSDRRIYIRQLLNTVLLNIFTMNTILQVYAGRFCASTTAFINCLITIECL